MEASICNRGKTGSICCVAIRLRSSPISNNNDVWFVAPNEAHWRVNRGFSPALSLCWDNVLPCGKFTSASHSSQLNGTSFLPSGRGNRSISRGGSGSIFSYHREIPDNMFSDPSCPFDSLCDPQWRPVMQGGTIADFVVAGSGASGQGFTPHVITIVEGEVQVAKGLPHML